MISVCMATYNGEKYIKEQLDSILGQIGKDDEVLISDDGSSDKTLEIIKEYNDCRIVLFENYFKNVVHNFEFIINKAKGEYIFLSDQDDIWHKDKVKNYLESFSKISNQCLIISDLQIIDKNGEFSTKSFYKKKFSKSLMGNIVINNFIGCAMAFSSELKKTILPFPKHIGMHDWWIGTCSILNAEIVFIDKKLVYYRRHDNNVTKEGGANYITKIKWRLNLIRNLAIRNFLIR